MNKKYFISSLAILVVTTASLMAEVLTDERDDRTNRINLTYDITNEILEINETSFDKYEHIYNVAQQKNADWSNVIGIARDISIEKAKKIANKNSEITFFFYTTGIQMVLEKEDGSYRVFHNGDAVFFSGNPSWGSAVGLADGYIKK